MDRMSSSMPSSSGSGGVADEEATEAEQSPSEAGRPLDEELVISDRTNPSIPLVMERTGNNRQRSG